MIIIIIIYTLLLFRVKQFIILLLFSLNVWLLNSLLLIFLKMDILYKHMNVCIAIVSISRPEKTWSKVYVKLCVCVCIHSRYPKR